MAALSLALLLGGGGLIGVLLSVLLCMRHHLVSEATVRHIPLHGVRATMGAEVTDAWELERLTADVLLELDPASQPAGPLRCGADALAAIRARREASSVLRNLPASTGCALSVALQN